MHSNFGFVAGFVAGIAAGVSMVIGVLILGVELQRRQPPRLDRRPRDLDGRETRPTWLGVG